MSVVLLLRFEADEITPDAMGAVISQMRDSALSSDGLLWVEVGKTESGLMLVAEWRSAGDLSVWENSPETMSQLELAEVQTVAPISRRVFTSP